MAEKVAYKSADEFAAAHAGPVACAAGHLIWPQAAPTIVGDLAAQ